MELRRTAGTATFVTFPIIDADGDVVTGAAALDSEWVAYADGAGPGAAGNPGFQDMASEATELGTTGIYALAVAAAELPLASPYVYIQIKTGTAGAKTQHLLINTATWYADVTRWDGVEAGPHPLYPTTAGRALDVSVGGEAGVDWANIGSPTTAQNLSATNIDVDQIVASVSGAVGSVTADVNLAMGQSLPASPTQSTTGHALVTARQATEYLDADISSRLAPTTSGRTLDVDAAGGAEVGSFQIGAITSGAFGAGAIDAAAIAADAIGDSELDMAVASTFADAFLRRNIVSGTSGAGGGGDRDVRSALFGLRNRVSIVAGTMTVYDVTDTATWWTAAVASQAVSEILVEVDPA